MLNSTASEADHPGMRAVTGDRRSRSRTWLVAVVGLLVGAVGFGVGAAWLQYDEGELLAATIELVPANHEITQAQAERDFTWGIPILPSNRRSSVQFGSWTEDGQRETLESVMARANAAGWRTGAPATSRGAAVRVRFESERAVVFASIGRESGSVLGTAKGTPDTTRSAALGALLGLLTGTAAAAATGSENAFRGRRFGQAESQRARCIQTVGSSPMPTCELDTSTVTAPGVCRSGQVRQSTMPSLRL